MNNISFPKKINNILFRNKGGKLNWFKISYIGLFLISIPYIFETSGVDSASVFWEDLSAIASWAVFIVLLLLLPILYQNKKRNYVFIPILLLQIFLYFSASQKHSYTEGLLDPIYFLPVLLTFIIFDKQSINFNRNLVIFFFIPFFLVAVDKVITLGFQISCPFITPQAEYNPVYLSHRFFYKKGSTFVPNVQEVKNSPFYHINNISNIKNTIFLYGFCNWEDESVIKKLIEEGNVILCIQTHDSNSIGNFINTPSLTVNQINLNNKKTVIATLYSKILNKNYEDWWLRTNSKSYCGIGSTYTTFIRGKFKKDELEFSNYIKTQVNTKLAKEVY